ncbi:DUF1302 domain-containing protein [Sinimarinibacterium flocculans]|uniref:Uncharacterized protein DUF1302 n=1 Tax=Sinimarinibacterium flocculans TaxID=985250 RepID=A0A318EFR7_9GAMM|nr:DUF1302 family protein [Sinimarinibacterium flocculans]PXV69635.1 uncharacterized protein DUF1302 [Sinimarinibacterium flocculans]
MKLLANRRIASAVLAAACVLPYGSASAISFTLPWGEESIEGVLNSSVVIGASMRMQDRSTDYLGKANINPDVCGGPNQACQGLFRDQGHPAFALAAAPGQFSPNYDDGNWNYDKHDLTSGLLKITQDLTLTWGNYGIFAKGLYYHDWVNEDFEEYHPNLITAENRDEFALRDPTLGIVQYGRGGPVSLPRSGETLSQIGGELQLQDAYLFGSVPLWDDKELSFKIGRHLINWGESLLQALNSLNQANPVNANNFYRVGYLVEEIFTPISMISIGFEPFDSASLEAFYQFEWQPLEAPAPGSMMAVSDVVGVDNAVDYAYVQFGGSAEDPAGLMYPLYTPLSGVTNTSLTIERLADLEPRTSGQYGLSLKYYAETLNNGTEFGVYAMSYHSRLPYASFFSTVASCGRREGNALGIDAYDPVSFLLVCPDLPLIRSLTGGDVANATSNAVPLDTVKLLVEYPEDIHLFGLSFATTALGWSFQGEVAWRPNAPLQVDTEDLIFAAFGPTLSRCHDPDLPRLLPTGDALNGALGLVDTIFGLASQLTGGVIGVPNVLPAGAGCAGTTVGVGAVGPGSSPTLSLGSLGVYAPSDYVVDATGTPGAFTDTFDLAIGHAPGSARSFPAFVTPYRGIEAGENAACEPRYLGSQNRYSRDQTTDLKPNPDFVPYDRSNPCYIRGYERMDTFQFNLGGTQVLGASDNPIGADQILFVFEVGATWVPDLPDLDELQFEAAGTYAHASAGADGTGADRSRQACSYDPVTKLPRESCSFGVDGLRFNPSQANLDLYPDPFSWGYVMIGILRYESVFPGISFAPQFIWQHNVKGTAPGPGENFIEGRKTMDLQVETRYKSNLAFYLGYTWFTGGNEANLQRDKDMARAFVRVQF